METNKKIELLTEIVGEFNLSFNEIVAYWRENGKLPPETSAASSGAETIVRYKTPEKILPGMYIYADGLIYPEIIEGRQVKAVVGYVDSSKILGVCLHEAYLSWSSDFLELKEVREENNGKKATRLILEASSRKVKPAEAAQWCYDYAEDGVKFGEAFLPSIYELQKLFANIDEINISLKALGASLLLGGGGDYLSTSEHSSDLAWRLVPGSGTCLYYKISQGRVRPVLEIELN